MKKLTLALLVFGCSFTALQAQASKNNATEKHYQVSDLVDLDLSSKGFNVITKAPKGSRIIQDGNDIAVYGGKFFKMTFSKHDFSLPFNEEEKYENMAEKMADMKILASDAELNPSFVKFETEDENGFLKRNKTDMTFVRGLKSGDHAIIITDGMTFDVSPDKFTKYSDDDVKTMYAAAKATVAK